MPRQQAWPLCSSGSAGILLCVVRQLALFQSTLAPLFFLLLFSLVLTAHKVLTDPALFFSALLVLIATNQGCRCWTNPAPCAIMGQLRTTGERLNKHHMRKTIIGRMIAKTRNVCGGGGKRCSDALCNNASLHCESRFTCLATMQSSFKPTSLTAG